MTRPDPPETLYSPKHQASLPVVSIGEGIHAGGSQYRRWVVAATDSDALHEQAATSTRIAATCLAINRKAFGRELPLTLDRPHVKLILSESGDAGAEQFLAHDPTVRTSLPGSYVYLYEAQTLTDPLERLREIAHEIGHATFPAIGGYSAPESWINGDIGERLTLTAIRSEMALGLIHPSDVGGVTTSDLDKYLGINYYPLATQFDQIGFIPSRLEDSSANGFSYFLGLVVSMDQTLPPEVFRRALALSGGSSRIGMVEGLQEAAAEHTESPIELRNMGPGKTVWVPTRIRKIRGGTVVATRGQWTKIRATSSSVSVEPPSIKN